jgi:hypothetical protein
MNVVAAVASLQKNGDKPQSTVRGDFGIIPAGPDDSFD